MKWWGEEERVEVVDDDDCADILPSNPLSIAVIPAILELVPKAFEVVVVVRVQVELRMEER